MYCSASAVVYCSTATLVPVVKSDPCSAVVLTSAPRLGDPMFAMDDVNDAEGETEDELEGEEGLGQGEGSSGVVHRTLSYPLQQPPTGAGTALVTLC